MKLEYNKALKVGILGGIAFTIVLALWDIMHIASWVQPVIEYVYFPGLANFPSLMAIVHDRGYLEYPPLVFVFLATGFVVVHRVKPYIGDVWDACLLSAISGLVAGIFGAVAYNVLWVARPIIETAVVVMMTCGFDLKIYQDILLDNDVIGFGDTFSAVINVIFNIVVAGPVILVSGIVLAIIGGIVGYVFTGIFHGKEK